MKPNMISLANIASGTGEAVKRSAEISPRSQKSPPRSIGFSQIKLMNKMATFREKKNFKSFSELVIQKEKTKKATKRDFLSAMVHYLQDVDSVKSPNSATLQGRYSVRRKRP